MTDTTKLYVNTADGYVYYYDGTVWTQGWLYQATRVSSSDYVITDLQKALNIEIIDTPTETGKIIKTHQSPVDFEHPVVSPSGFDYYLISCQEGDAFTITGTGGNQPRLWCFIDSNGVILANSIPDLVATNMSIVAPENTAYLIVNKIGTCYIWKGYDVNNKLENDYIETINKYKAESGIDIGQEINYISHNQGLINCKTLQVQSSNVSYYNLYDVKEGDTIYVSGKTGGVGENYSLIVFVDENNNIISKYGTENLMIYTDLEIKVPKNAVKAYVNGAGGETISIKNALIFNKTLKEVYEEIATDMLPETMIYNRLGHKQVGVFEKPYICISSDDGLSQLYTNTIPNILEKVHTDTGVYIPFTFALMSTSNVLQDTTKLNAIKDMVNNKNCSIAYHGTTNYTTYTKQELISYLDSEEQFFNNLSLHPKGCVYPNHSHNNMVMAICGSREGVACAGGAIVQDKLYSSPRKNMYELYRTSLLYMTLEEAKEYIDYAYAHNYLICFFFHDISIAQTEGATDKVVAIIEYAIQKGMNFCNIGDIPSLV